MDSLTSNAFKANILGKVYSIKFEMRNFIALKKKFNIEAGDLITRVLEGDLEAILLMIWCGTLIFNDKFDIANPTDIKEEISLEKLYKMEYSEIQKIGLEITKGLLNSLPSADSKKKKGLIAKIKAILKIK